MSLAFETPGISSREIGLWGTAGAVVLAAHLAVAYILSVSAPEPTTAAFEEAMTVDLTPFVMMPAEEVQADSAIEEVSDVTPDQPVEEFVEEQPEDVVTETEETPVEEIDVAEPVQEEQAEPVIEEVEQETVAELEEFTEVMPTPRPEVVIQEPEPEPKSVEKPVQRKVEKPKPDAPKKDAPKKKVVKKEPTQRTQSAATGNKNQAAAQTSRAKKVNPARWHSQVYAAIARRKPRSKGTSGNVMVRFVVNSSGSIVSASVARSSGNATLDSAALSMVRGARVPAPPADLPGSQHPFTVPVSFR